MIKYVFQFGFFPWTTKIYRGINADEPFVLPNMAGVEKKDGYVHYDLVQLLALFFHRYTLKVWSSILQNAKRKLKSSFSAWIVHTYYGAGTKKQPISGAGLNQIRE